MYIRLLAVVFIVSSILYAQNLSIDDIIWLKNSGFSEQEIVGEIQNTKTQIPLTKEDVERLRKAGFNDATIKKMGSWPFSDEVTIENIVKWSKSGESEESIIEKIRKSEKRFELSIRDVLNLKKSGVSKRVIHVLRESGSLTFEKLQVWYKQKLPEEKILKMVQSFSQRPKLSIAQTLKLRRLGMTKLVLDALQNQSSAVETTEPTKVEHVVQDTLTYITYKDITGLVEVEYPKNWRIMQEAQNTFRMCFTPDTQTAKIEDVKLGVNIHVEVMEYGSSYDFLPIAEVYSRMLPGYLQTNGKYQLREISRNNFKIADVDAVEGTFSAVMDGVSVEERTIIVYKDGIEFRISFTAPQNIKQEYRHIFDKMRASIKLLPPKLLQERLKTPVSSEEVVSLAKQATVLVHAQLGAVGGTGTGFIVSPDGYIITNHHVCFDHSNNFKEADSLYVTWDSKLGKQKLPARLIAAWNQNEPVQKDVALLKIEGTGYPFLPLASPSHVLESDRVIAFGFPRTDVFGSSDITVTGGTIIRLVENHKGQLNKIFIDAKITHGNSGGPCFDLNLGGVIGINTAVYKGELLGYNITLPITIALEEFPELYYPHGRGLSETDHLKLAILYKGKKLYRGASRCLKQTTTLNPKNATAWGLMGQVLLDEANNREGKEKKQLKQQGLSAYQRALKIDPKLELALYGLANYYWSVGNKIDTFRYYDRIISYYPESIWGYDNRAYLYLNAGRYEDAVRDAQMAIKMNNNLHPNPYITLGQIYYQQKKYEEGKEQYEKAIAVNQNYLPGHYGRINYYIQTGKHGGAEIEYARLLEKFPGTPEVLEQVGNFYNFHKKDASQALHNYRQAMDIYKQKKLIPSLSLARNVGNLAYDAKDYSLALEAENHRLFLESEIVGQSDAMQAIGNVFWRLNKGDVGDAFYCMAFATNEKNQAILKYLQSTQLTPLQATSIDSLLNVYPSLTVAKLVLSADLAFTFSAEQLDSLQGKVPADLFAALLIRAKNSWKPIRPNFQKTTTTTPPNNTNNNETTLMSNIKLKIKKFYYDGNNWLVDFTVENLNQVAVTNAEYLFTFKNAQQQVVKTLAKPSGDIIEAGKTFVYDAVSLLPYKNYAHIQFIEIRVVKVQGTKSSNTNNNFNDNSVSEDDLKRNMKLTIPKFYYDGRMWYVNFVVENNNKVSVAGIQYEFVLKDRQQKVVKTLTLSSQDTIPAQQKFTYNNTQLVPYAGYQHVGFIEIRIIKISAK